MGRSTVDDDESALALARQELRTTGLSATVDAALRDVVRRRTLARFDVRRDIDGTPDEVGANRHDQGPG